MNANKIKGPVMDTAPKPTDKRSKILEVAPVVVGALADNIPIPASKRGPGASGSKYGWDTMNIGQSFFMDQSVKGASAAASNAATRYGKFYTVRAVTEKIGDVMVEGARVWRVEPYIRRTRTPKSAVAVATQPTA